MTIHNHALTHCVCRLPNLVEVAIVIVIVMYNSLQKSHIGLAEKQEVLSVAATKLEGDSNFMEAESEIPDNQVPAICDP